MQKFFKRSLYSIVILLVLVQSSFALNQVELSVEYIANPAIGRALSLADIYVGVVDLDPKIVGNQKQISVLQENGTTVQVAQPINTSAGGVPLYNGSPVTILVDGSYSLRIDDSTGTQQYYVPKNAELESLSSIASITALRAMAETPANGDVFNVLGYAASTENRDWQFQWSTADLSTEVAADTLGGIYVALNSSPTGASGAFIRLHNPEERRVPWFGSNTTPGTTDMVPIVQAAVDSFSSPGGILYFEDEIYFFEGAYSPWSGLSRLVDGVKVKSNITFQGAGYGTEIRQSIDCGFSFTTRLQEAVTDPTNANQPKNIAFYNMRFTQPDTPVVWQEQKHLLNIESVTGLTIRDCWFIGWSGDAITLGATTDATLSVWLQSYVQNATIDNCYFDGVDLNNRQAISLLAGEDVDILNSYFTRISRPDMPGVIDLEPEGAWPLFESVNIQGNKFIDNGGGVGTIAFAFSEQTVPAKNITVLDNTFKNNANSLYEWYVQGPNAVDHTAVASNSPERIRIERNTVYNTSTRLMYIGGVKDVSVKDNIVTRDPAVLCGGSFLGFGDGALVIKPVEGLTFTGNKFRGITVNGAPPTPVFSILGGLLGADISGNEFIDCGNYTGAAFGEVNVFNFLIYSLDSYAVTMKKNRFINNGDYSVSSVPISEVFGAGPLTYPETFFLESNFFYGFDKQAYNNVNSLYLFTQSDYYNEFMTLTDAANPAINGGRKFLTGGTTTITEFRFGKVGQEIIIIAEHAITITDNANIILAGSANFIMAATDTLTLIQKADGFLYEVSRSVN